MTTFKQVTVAVFGLLAGVASAARSQAAEARSIVHGPLRVVVAYPGAGSSIDFGDSTFIFGTVGDGAATVTVAGQPATVAPNGAWLAWVALPHDSIVAVAIVARDGGDSATATLHLVRTNWVRESGAWIDLKSRSPVGNVWLPRDEPLPLVVRAAPGAVVRLVLPNGKVVRFSPDSIASQPIEGLRNFDRDARNLRTAGRGDRYVASLTGDIAPAVDAGRFLDSTSSLPARPSPPAILEVSLNGKVARIPWPIHVTRIASPPIAVFLDDDIAHRGGTDRITIGRAFPAGTYTWFLPQGTRTRADMRIEDEVRLRLSRNAVAWVPIADVHRAPASGDARPAVMGSPTLAADSNGAQLRIPLTRPVPHSVDESERAAVITLFDAVSNANWTRYGADQRFVRLLTWKQEAEDRVTLTLNFDRLLWGWRVRVDGTDLVFDFRRPPAIDPDHPVRGRRIVVDPGHPPGGACGPTGLCEPESNLAIASVVRDELIAAGATVFMTRVGPGDVGLWPRVAFADSVDAELLVSIHNNALPDGVNPFTNNGTSTFFNHPHSLALALAVQARLVANIGLRDLGIARGDLALTRPTWYPAILSEGMFMMFPDQEATLRSPAGQHRYAVGVVEGITAFLAAVARRGD